MLTLLKHLFSCSATHIYPHTHIINKNPLKQQQKNKDFIRVSWKYLHQNNNINNNNKRNILKRKAIIGYQHHQQQQQHPYKIACCRPKSAANPQHNTIVLTAPTPVAINWKSKEIKSAKTWASIILQSGSCQSRMFLTEPILVAWNFAGIFCLFGCFFFAQIFQYQFVVVVICCCFFFWLSIKHPTLHLVICQQQH